MGALGDLVGVWMPAMVEFAFWCTVKVEALRVAEEPVFAFAQI